MIFSSVGSVGTTETYHIAGNTTLPFSPASTIPAGDLVVVFTAWDSIFDLFSDTGCPMHNRIACWDDAGNIWTMIAAGTGTNCFLACGAYAGLFVCQLTNDITSADTITVQCEHPMAAKAMSLWQFEVEAGWGWAAVDLAYGCLEGRPGLAAMTTTYNTPQEYLWLYALGSEGPNTDSFTIDSAYTAIDQDGTTAGSPDDENMTIVGAWKIEETVAAETITNTNNTAVRDTLQLFGAITPVRLLDEFPTQGILDNFNRANENPLDNSTWDTVDTAGPSSPGTRYLQLLSNLAAADPSGAGGQFWAQDMECNDVEVYATYTTVGTLSLNLIFHADGSTNAVTAVGYACDLTNKTNAGPDNFWSSRLGLLGNQGGVDASSIYLWLPPTLNPTNGWKLGARRDGDWNHLFFDMGSGWEWVGAVNTQRGSRRTQGEIGLAIYDATGRADDFGGGEVCPPQFYRRIG